MARQRRGGFRPPELRGTLGTLLRTTLAQASGLAREGRARLDDALAGRRRTDALAELGELVLDLIRRGEIEIDQLPEAKELVAHLDELDGGAEEEADYSPPPPTPRSRFDARGKDDGTVSSSRWVPPAKPAARVWKPPVVVDESERHVEPPPPVQKKLGGISFGKDNGDDDSDLADFMHPDDVPPKAK